MVMERVVTALVLLVFPFAPLSGTGPDSLWVAAGLTRYLGERLATVEQLTQVSPADPLPLWAERLLAGRTDRQDMLQLARAQQARTLVAGSVERRGEQLLVRADLVNIETGEATELESMQVTLQRFFAAGNELAARIAKKLGVMLTAEEQSRLAAPPTVSLSAFEAEVHLQLASVFLELQYGELAYQEAAAYQRLNPAQARGMYLLGRSAYLLAHFDEAISAFQSFVKASPEEAKGHFDLANAYRAGGKLDEAIQEFLETIRLVPDWSDAHLLLGEVLEQRGDLASSIAAYENYLQKAPDTPQEKPWREKAQAALLGLRKRLR